MKKSIYIKFILLALPTLLLTASAFGQVVTPSEAPQPLAKKPLDMRTVVLGQLGLSREQMQQIRRLNGERKPAMDDAQKRLREANLALDATIYSDQATEGDVQAKLKEAQLAQGEVARIRFMNEFAVRKILTADQLVRFRDLRQKFEQTRDGAGKNGQVNAIKQGEATAPAGTRPPLRDVKDAKQELKPGIRPNPRRLRF